MTEVSAAALGVHPFLRGMPEDQLAMLARSARAVSFPARSRLFEDGGYASRFWLIRSGHVWLDLNVPGEGPVVIETIGMGELLGWSWLFPPYTWVFGAVAAIKVEAFDFDAATVRDSCRADPGLGLEINRRITAVLAKRLKATRIRLATHAGQPSTALLPVTEVPRSDARRPMPDRACDGRLKSARAQARNEVRHGSKKGRSWQRRQSWWE